MKGNDYKEWIDFLNKKVKTIFLFGESSSVLKKALIDGGIKKDIFEFPNLLELINYLFLYIRENKVEKILFSPSCSSFDQFKDYEERGDFFRKLINEKFVNH